MISKCFIDEVRIYKHEGTWTCVSVTIIPPDSLSKEPKLVADYDGGQDNAQIIQILMARIGELHRLKSKIIALGHLKDWKYSVILENGSHKTLNLIASIEILESIALLVEHDLLRDRDKMHEKLTAALRFLWMNYEGENRGIALDFAINVLSQTREGHEAWYNNITERFEAKFKRLKDDIGKKKSPATRHTRDTNSTR